MKYEVKKVGDMFKVWNNENSTWITKEIPDEEIAKEICSDFEKMENGDLSPLGLTKITKQLLLEDGWLETKEDPTIILHKPIPNRNPINSSPDDSGIKLIVHGLYNSWTFAIQLPDGGLLNFVANSMESLQGFERSINFYDPPY